MISLTFEQELANAYEAGGYAYENARGLDACPMFAMGERGTRLRERWARGWHDADARNDYKRTRTATKPAEPGRAQPIRSGRRRK